MLIASWERSLRATRRSPKTIKNYGDAGRQLVAYLKQAGMPTIAAGVHREHVEAFLIYLGESRSASTVATRYRGLQQFFKWLIEEGEITESPMRNMKPPTVPETPVPILDDIELKRLLKTCDGREFDERRDQALIRLLLDAGMRRAEAANLRVEDIDWDDDVALVVGKGARPRSCPFGAKTAQALDRYLRARRSHPWATAHSTRFGSAERGRRASPALRKYSAVAESRLGSGRSIHTSSDTHSLTTGSRAAAAKAT